MKGLSNPFLLVEIEANVATLMCIGDSRKLETSKSK